MRSSTQFDSVVASSKVRNLHIHSFLSTPCLFSLSTTVDSFGAQPKMPSFGRLMSTLGMKNSLLRVLLQGKALTEKKLTGLANLVTVD